MKQIQKVFDNAQQLFPMPEIDKALDSLALSLTQHYQDSNPILLCVMNGAIMTLGHLLPKLCFPLELDYIHVTRYGDKIVGGELNWLHKPAVDLTGRHIILIEDIFDEGITLKSLREFCEEENAKSVSCVALVDKLHSKKVGIAPEFIGLKVPDRYVFGFGMDYKGYWRNAPGIYAVNEHDL